MADTYLVEPDVGFINEVAGLGGGDLKKVLSMRDLFRGLPDFTGDQTLSEKRNDRSIVGAQRQIGRQRRYLAVPQLRRLHNIVSAWSQTG